MLPLRNQLTWLACGLFEEPQAQLLYLLLPEFTGQGDATEGSATNKVYAFNELNYEYVDASFALPTIVSLKICQVWVCINLGK